MEDDKKISRYAVAALTFGPLVLALMLIGAGAWIERGPGIACLLVGGLLFLARLIDELGDLVMAWRRSR